MKKSIGISAVVAAVLILFLSRPISRQIVEFKGKVAIRETMHRFYRHLYLLRPYITSKGRFTSDAADLAIIGHLQALRTDVNLGLSVPEIRDSSYNIVLEQLSEHLADIEKTYEVGKKESARWMLGATSRYCISCHTQIPHVSTVSLDWRQDLLVEAKETPFEYADYLFVTRRYDTALKIFDELIRSYPENEIDEFELDTAIRRKLAAWVRIRRDPQAAILSFQKDLKNDKLPVYDKHNINSWLSYLQTWSGDSSLDGAPTKKLLAYVKSHVEPHFSGRSIPVSDPNLVMFLRVSGLLYERLNSSESEGLRDQIFYYIPRVEELIGSSFIYALSGGYYKACIRQFPKSEYAKKSFVQYSNFVFRMFETESISEIPETYANELNELSALLGK